MQDVEVLKDFIRLLLSVFSAFANPAVYFIFHFLPDAVHFMLHLIVHPLHLLKQIKDYLNAGEIDTHLLGEPLNLLKPLDVRLRIQPVFIAYPLRMDQTEPLIEPERLRMHFTELCGYTYHVDWFVSIYRRHIITFKMRVMLIDSLLFLLQGGEFRQ